MRNNSGALKDATGRVVRYGLGNISERQNAHIKSSDLIGITTITITPDMVGRTVGIFTAVEVKRPEWKPSEKDPREKAQRNFVEWVRSRGGIAAMVNSVESFREMFGK